MANFIHFNPFKGDDEDHRRERATEGGGGRGVGGGGRGDQEEEGGGQQPGRAGDQQVACLGDWTNHTRKVKNLVIMVSRLLIGEDELKTSQFEAGGQGGWVEKDPETTQSFKRRQQVGILIFSPNWISAGVSSVILPNIRPATRYQYNLTKQCSDYSTHTLEY